MVTLPVDPWVARNPTTWGTHSKSSVPKGALWPVCPLERHLTQNTARGGCDGAV